MSEGSNAAAIVFVSYSHGDSRALLDLKKHLAPLEREGAIKVWADTRIDLAADGDGEIENALETCAFVIPVISAAFFASSYIVDHEIPVMVRRRAKGEVKIVPIFWTPVSEPELDKLIPAEERSRNLSAWQGVAAPSRTMMSLSRVKREEELKKLVDWLRKQLGKSEKVPRASATTPAKAPDDRRIPLSIELERTGDILSVHYRQPGQKPFKTRTLSWAIAAATAQAVNRNVANFRHTFEPAFTAAPSLEGKQLLQLLFGDQLDWAPLLEKIFEHKNAAFTLHPVDLRIVARDPELAQLPWRLLAYPDRFLTDAGWTIATAHEVDSTIAVQTLTSAPVLIVAAGEDGGLGELLEIFLRDIWKIPEADRRIRLCRKASELRSAASEISPHLVVVTGQASGSSLLFPDGKFPCRELEAASSTKLLFYACRGLAGHEPQLAAPCILWPRLSEPGSGWNDQVLAFFEHWLLAKLDPVRAFHALGSELDRATYHLVANYRSWQVAGAAKPESNVLNLLDRIDQKARVLRECQQLAKSGSPRKVLALIAHAASEDGVDHHSDQLLHMLETEGHQLVIDKLRLEIPEVRQDLRRDLEDLLCQVTHQPGDVRKALNKLKPRRVGDTIPILWIDCGCTDGHHFDREALLRWIAFAEECLLPNCPENLRIVLYVGIRFDEASVEGAGQSLAEVEAKSVHLGAGLTALKRLHEVPVKELSDYLRDHSNCPDPAKVAPLIHAATKGRFLETVKKIEEGLKSWDKLQASLSKEHPAVAKRPKGW